MSLIRVHELTMVFKVNILRRGIWSNIRSLLKRSYRLVTALDHVSFDIAEGEIVGYIGPNGAGKSTTIKVLAGVLVPTEGDVLVDGVVPHKNRMENARRIGVVFGQRTHLHWDLPVIDSFDLYKAMYAIDVVRYKRNLGFFTELLDLGEMLVKPVRQLSLGQKMRCELAGALLREPKILYLDEPTIGLDVVARGKILDFILQVNRERKTTIIITTHNMDDIEYLCNRLIMIDKGHIIYDGGLAEFKKRYGGDHDLIVDFAADGVEVDDPRFKVRKREGQRLHLSFSSNELSVAEALAFISKSYEIRGMTFTEPDIEGIVKRMYGPK